MTDDPIPDKVRAAVLRDLADADCWTGQQLRYPIGDLIEHDTDDDDCVCGPTVVPVPRDDGSMGWVIVHHSLDGREADE